MRLAVKRRKLSAAAELYSRVTEPVSSDPSEWPETLERVRMLLRQIDTPQFIALLNIVVRDAPDLADAAIAWIDLIQVLIANTETRYRGSDRGELKKAEVKAVVSYLLRSEHPDIPNVPGYLEPVVLDLFADFAVDAIVAFLNRYQDPRWVQAQAQPAHPSISELWRSVVRVIGRIAGVAFEPVGRLVASLYLALRHPVRLSPALRSALQAVERESETARRGPLLREVSELGSLVAQNRDALIAGIELVSVAVHAVEAFIWMSSAQKKESARRLISLVLDELGFDSSSLVVSVKVDFAADFLIDATVHLFNARGLFSHRGASPQRAVAARR